jgi:hypothetical protein
MGHWRSVVTCTPCPFYSREKRPRYQLDRRLGGPLNRRGRRWQKKNLTPAGIRIATPQPSNPEPCAVTAAVPRESLIKSEHLGGSTESFCEPLLILGLNIVLPHRVDTTGKDIFESPISRNGTVNICNSFQVVFRINISDINGRFVDLTVLQLFGLFASLVNGPFYRIEVSV